MPGSRSTSSAIGKRRPAAYTLTEVLMAVFVLAFALSTSITTLQRAFFNLDSARCLETANRILECELEKERLMTWASVTNTSYQPTIDTGFSRDPTIAGRFTLSRHLTTVAGYGGKLTQVRLTVAWRSYDGHNLSRTHATYFSEGGLNDFICNRS